MVRSFAPQTAVSNFNSNSEWQSFLIVVLTSEVSAHVVVVLRLCLTLFLGCRSPGWFLMPRLLRLSVIQVALIQVILNKSMRFWSSYRHSFIKSAFLNGAPRGADTAIKPLPRPLRCLSCGQGSLRSPAWRSAKIKIDEDPRRNHARSNRFQKLW